MSEHRDKTETAYLVLGGELRDFSCCEFADANTIEIVGVFSDYDSARKAWRGRAMETVDNALQRYCIIGLDTALKQAHQQ